jgi:hypothetical protein
MARIRSIHPGIWTDEQFVSVSAYARLLAMGLWNEADDQGVFEWKPITLKMRILPADTVDVAVLLAELVSIGNLMRYEIDEKPYGAIRNFRKFQRPEKPNAVHPLGEGVRKWVGLDSTTHTCSAKKPPPSGGESSQCVGEPAPEPTEPTPNDRGLVDDHLPTATRKSGQMEEEGGREGEERKEEPKAAPLAPIAPKSAKDILWQDGRAILSHLTGKSPNGLRGLMGKWASDLQDDCPRLMLLIQQAQEAEPGEPVAWITKAVNGIKAQRLRAAEPRFPGNGYAIEAEAARVRAEAAGPALRTIDSSFFDDDLPLLPSPGGYHAH